MRIIFLSVLLCAYSICNSQKIKSEYDKFEKALRVESGWLQIKPTLAAPLSIRFRSIGTSYFISFAGSNVGSSTVGSGDKVQILLDGDTKLEVLSTGVQSYEIGQYGNSFRHQYSIERSQLEELSNHKILSIRKYGTSTFADFDISEKHSEDHKKTIVKFLEVVDKKSSNP